MDGMKQAVGEPFNIESVYEETERTEALTFVQSSPKRDLAKGTDQPSSPIFSMDISCDDYTTFEKVNILLF